MALNNSGNQEIPSWLGLPPEVSEDQIHETIVTDVVVVGAGVAGLSAARAASEAGAAVVVVEKGTSFQFRSGQYGTIGSKIHRDLGVHIDKNAAILENMKQTGYRADQRIWKYWADHSGAALDWMLELAPDLEVIPENAMSFDDSKIIIQPLHFPPPPAYNPAEEYSPTYPTILTFLPDQRKILERVYDRCLEQGCRFLFSTWGIRLIRPDNRGPVQGILCRNLAGEYLRIEARKGVVLATGDFGSNKEMVAGLTPWAARINSYFNSRDAKGERTNTGDGHKMAIWAGGKLEDGPHAPMTHTLGGPLGVDAFFLANTRGERFVNEDVGGQQLSVALYRQPGDYGWQIFDDRWPEQIGLMGVSHGSVNFCVPDDENPKLPGTGGTIGKTSFVSREEVNRHRNTRQAATLEELVAMLELDQDSQERLLASIERYNELCALGVDEDFGKTSRRLFPILHPPFYAAKIVAGGMLVCLGGMTCDPFTGNVLDEEYQGIPGLYVAGNTMGGRFLTDYPVVTAGVSHGFALTYGRLVGNVVATL